MLLRQKLERLAAASDDLQMRLPNFACRETLVSQELRGGRIKNEVSAAGDLRIQHNAEGDLVESLQATERNGKPFRGANLKLPVFLFGGFKNVLFYFQPQVQQCFRFRLSGNRMDFESAPDAEAAACRQTIGIKGFVSLDAAGNITHLERHVEDAAARARNSAPFVATDLSQVELGGIPFSLASHVLADISIGPSQLHWDGAYSECRLFHVTVTLGPVVDPVSGPKP